MPVFHNRQVDVDPLLSDKLLKQLRDIGHGHRLTIVGRSYVIPNGPPIYDYSARSDLMLRAAVQLIPIETAPDSLVVMKPDGTAGIRATVWDNVLALRSAIAFRRTFEAAQQHGAIDSSASLDQRYRLTEDAASDPEPLDRRDVGFYDLADNPDQQSTFVRTIDELPFACVSLVVGHSQLTE